MNQVIVNLWLYIKQLTKKWIFLLVYYFSLIGIFYLVKLLKRELPSWMYWTFALVGLFWASYKTYKDKIPANSILEKKPNILIQLIEGNSYTYSLLEDEETKKEAVPDAFIVLHSRISNQEKLEIDILALDLRYDSTRSSLYFDEYYGAHLYDAVGQKINFPVHLNKQGIYLCDFKNRVSKSPSLNDAQFASRFVNINKEFPDIKVEIEAEVRDLKGSLHNFSFQGEISTRSLVELFINKWQKDGKMDLLNLAHIEKK